MNSIGEFGIRDLAMPASTSWINPGRIIKIRLEGVVSSADVALLRSQLLAALQNAPGKLNYLLDLGNVTSFEQPMLRRMLSKGAPLRSAKTGRMAVLGATQAQHLVLDSAALTLHLSIGYFDDERKALAFIAET